MRAGGVSRRTNVAPVGAQADAHRELSRNLAHDDA